MSGQPRMGDKPARIPEFGVCPSCFTDQPLIWDGCIKPHQVMQDRPGSHAFAVSCPGSMHVPADAEPPPHVHRCSCGVTFTEDTQ